MADQKGGAQGNARYFFADCSHQFRGLRAGDLATHQLQHRIAGVLERNIEVVAYFRPFGHHVEYVQRKFGGISVVQPDPFDAFYVGQGMEQARQLALFVQIEAVVGQLLGDEQQFFYATPGQVSGFGHQLIDRATDVLAAHQRNGTERAGTVAAFRDLQVCVVGQRGDLAFAEQFVLVVGIQPGQQGGHFQGTKKGVHLRYFLLQCILVALRQTARDVQFLDLPGFFQGGMFHDALNALLFGQVNKAAGIDNHYVSLGVFALVGYFIVIAPQLGDEIFTVHQVFGTTQGDHIYFVGTKSSGAHG